MFDVGEVVLAEDLVYVLLGVDCVRFGYAPEVAFGDDE